MWNNIKNWFSIQPALEAGRRKKYWALAYALGCGLVLCLPGHWSWLVGLVLLAAEAAAWLQSIGRELPLRGLLRMMVLLTMWVAPGIAYWGVGASWYIAAPMQVPAQLYWLLAAPGTAALNMAIRLTETSETAGKTFVSPSEAVAGLLPIGIAAQILLPRMPEALHQGVYFLSQFIYVSILYALLAWPAKRWWWVAGGSVYAAFVALQTTFFGNALLWILLMVIAAVRGQSIPALRRYGLAIGGGLAIWVLLSFKYEYRIAVQQPGPGPLHSRVFVAMLWEQLSHPARLFRPEVFETVVTRFNQGYYTAQAMAWTPAHEPFAKGGTIAADAWAALVPRFLDPGKHRAGGVENMKRFAGVTGRTYSMNIGIFGEAYVNFGIAGGVVCLFGYGLLLGGAMNLAVRYADLPWWPFLFLPALDVESDMGIVWNHIAKAGIIVIVFMALYRLRKNKG